MKTEILAEGEGAGALHQPKSHRPENQRARERLRSFLHGHDLFISYSRGDGFWYAHKLASQLAGLGFACYLDQLETIPDREVPEKVLAELRRSTRLLIIGSPIAAQSLAIRKEIETFVETGRHIILIDFGGAVRGAVWAHLVPGLEPLAESRAALRREKGTPSDDVINGVRAAAEYTRRNRKVRNVFLSLLAGIVLAFGLGAGTLVWAASAVRDAERQTTQARAQQAAADRAASEARDRAAAADESARLAGVRSAAADVLRYGAEWLQGVAEGRAAEADAKALAAEGREAAALEKERAANEKAEEARRLSLARRLAAKSETVRRERTGQLELSALLAIESMNQSPSADGNLALRSALSLYRSPVAELRVENGGISSWVEPKFAPDDKTFATARGGSVTVWRGLGDGGDVRGVELEHEKVVEDYEFGGPQGVFLATASEDGARVWAARAGALRWGPLAHEGPVSAVAFHPGGAQLASGGADGTIRFWDLNTGHEDAGRRLTLSDEAGAPLKVNALSFDAAGGGLLSAAAGDDTVLLWDLRGRRELLRQKVAAPADERRHPSLHVELSRGGRYVLTRTEGNQWSLWEVAAPETPGDTAAQAAGGAAPGLKRIAEHVSAAAFSDDGQFYATAQGDEVTVYTLEDGAPRVAATLHHEGEIDHVVFSTQAKYLATSGRDWTTRVWRIAGSRPGELTGKEVARIERRPWYHGFAFGRDGRFVLVNRDEDRLAAYEVPVGGAAAGPSDGGPPPHLEPGKQYLSVAYSPNGAYMVAAEADGYWVKEVSGGREVERRRHGLNDRFTPVAVSSDGRLLAGWSGDELRLRDTAAPPGTYADVKKAPARVRFIQQSASVFFSPDGARLAVNADGGVLVWKVAGGRLSNEQVLGRGPWRPNTLAFNPADSRYLATGSEGSLRLWDAEGGTEFAGARRNFVTPPGKFDFPRNGNVAAVAFSPDGSRLVALTEGSLVSDAADPERIRPGDRSAFLDDERARIRVWKFTDGRIEPEQTILLRFLPSAAAFGRAGEWDRGQTYLAVASFDGSIEIRRWPDLAEVAGFSTEANVGSITFGADAGLLFTSPANHLTLNPARSQAWLMRPAELVEDARRRVPNSLTDEEARSFELAGDRLCSVCPGRGGRR